MRLIYILPVLLVGFILGYNTSSLLNPQPKHHGLWIKGGHYSHILIGDTIDIGCAIDSTIAIDHIDMDTSTVSPGKEYRFSK